MSVGFREGRSRERIAQATSALGESFSWGFEGEASRVFTRILYVEFHRLSQGREDHRGLSPLAGGLSCGSNRR